MRVTNTRPWWNEFAMRFFCLGSSSETTTISTPGQGKEVKVYHFIDWDTRRDYYVVTPDNFCRGNMEWCDIQTRVWDALKRYLPILSLSVRLIMIDDDYRLQAVSPNPSDLIGIPIRGLNTLVPDFEWPQFEHVNEFSHLPTVNRSQMIEVDRLAPRVDIMQDTSSGGERVVAKWLLAHNASLAWREMLLLNSIPAHPHIIPISRIIVDDSSGRIVGWTSKYVDGPDLEVDKSQFKMKWLEQLIDTLDYLHLELGITHGDLQLKNLVVDKATDKLLLLDFEEADRIDEARLRRELNQLTWSLYEIVTHDMELVEERLYSPPTDDDGSLGDGDIDDDPQIINEMPEWPARANLDCEPQEIRQYLQSWIQRRTALPIVLPDTAIQLDKFTNPPSPEPSLKQDRRARKTRFEELQQKQTMLQKEKSLLQAGIIRWERPPYTKAFPERARKAISQSISKGKDVGRSDTQAQKRKSADIEGEGPPPKRAKLLTTAAPYDEDAENSEDYEELEITGSYYITLKLPQKYLNEARRQREIAQEILSK
ncbi:hypothetical protein F5Y10DRAFT_291994 [Nemania abortiva]|nr:hypothetical protein F5Y10DRAFT_291994 [Nemania abortiva]